ncbi:MAG TPA: hypothetical protein DDY61_05255 [Ruminococcaceae bacterium]|nr:hypothetical protein [Oscillospiraceae bacterium]
MELVMKKLLALFLSLTLISACFYAVLGVSAELADGAPFTAYDGKKALKISEYTTDDQKAYALPKVNLTKLSGYEYPEGNFEISVSVTYRLGGDNLSDSGIKPSLRLFYNSESWDQKTYEMQVTETITSDKWTTMSATFDVTDIKTMKEGETALRGAAVLLHSQGGRQIQSDLYVDSVIVKTGGETVINESYETYENGKTGTVGNTSWENNAGVGTMTVVELGEEEVEPAADFPAYKGEFALKIGKYTAAQNQKETVKIALTDLTKEEFLSGNQKYFISVTYRLGGEGLEDNGIKPTLKLYYNDQYWADTYPVSDTKTITSDKWTTVSGIVDATGTNTASKIDANSKFSAALLFHQAGEREVLSDLYIDEVKVEQLYEDGTKKEIINEGFEGLYDSTVERVKNKPQGENGFSAVLEYVRLGDANDSLSVVSADTQTVYEGNSALRIYRNNQFWNTNLCFDFWNKDIHTSGYGSIDFTVSVAYYSYGNKPMKLSAWLYYCYDKEDFITVPFVGEVTGLKGDWVEYTGTVTVPLESAKTLGITRIILGEDRSSSPTGADYAIDNLVITSTRTGETDLCNGYGGFEDDKLITDTKGMYVDEYANKSKTASDKVNTIHMERVSGPEYTEAYTPILSEKTVDDNGSFKVEALIPQARTRYEIKEYGTLFHRTEKLDGAELTLDTSGVKKAFYKTADSEALPEKYTSVLTDSGKNSKGYNNTKYTARPYVTYYDNTKETEVTFYGEQVSNRSSDYKTMPLGNFVNKTPTKLKLSEDNEYVLTTESHVQLPVENTVFNIRLNSDYRVGFIAAPGSTLNAEDDEKADSKDGDSDIKKGIVKWFKDGDKYSVHNLYLYVRVFVTHKDNIDSDGNIRNNVKVTDIDKTGLKLIYVGTANVVADNRAKMADIALNRGNYAVITHGSDVHGDIVRLYNMMQFSETIGADFAAVTGDITAFANRTGYSAFVNAMLGRKTNVIAVAGNHDIGYMPNGAESDLKKYNQLFSQLYSEYGYKNTESNKCYYYKDDEQHKLRVITLDQYERTNGVNDKYWEMRMNQPQVDFLIETLKSTPEDYSIVLAYHSPENARSTRKVVDDTFFHQLETSGDGVPAVVADIIDAFISRTSINKQYDTSSTYAYNIHATADFSDAKATFVAHLTGHQHIDGVAYLPTTNTQLMLNVSCMTASKGVKMGNALAESVDLIRSRDDYTQDCFNTYIIDTDKKVVRIIRIGADTKKDGGKRDYMNSSYTVTAVASYANAR